MQRVIGKNKIQKYIKMNKRKYVEIVNKSTGEVISVPYYKDIMEYDCDYGDRKDRFFKMKEYHEFLRRLNNKCPVARVSCLSGHENFDSLFCELFFGCQRFVLKFNHDLSLKEIYLQVFGDDKKTIYSSYDEFFNDKNIQILFEYAIAMRMTAESYSGQSKFI